MTNGQEKEAGTSFPLSCGEYVVHQCLVWEQETVKEQRKEMGVHIEIRLCLGTVARKYLTSQGLLGGGFIVLAVLGNHKKAPQESLK